MKYLFLLLISISCGKWNKVKSHYTGNGYEVCHKGVTYLQFSSGATVALDRKGLPLRCEYK